MMENFNQYESTEHILKKMNKWIKNSTFFEAKVDLVQQLYWLRV